MTATTDRRRNAYPDVCCVCRADVPAGAGWLYSDTSSSAARRLHRPTGRWPKKVKCDRCHTNGLTNRWQANNLDNPPPPAPRAWSSPDVCHWALEVETEATTRLTWPDPKAAAVAEPFVLVHVHVTIGDERVRLAGGEPISNHQVGPVWTLEERGIGGRPFSRAAWATLNDMVAEAVATAKS